MTRDVVVLNAIDPLLKAAQIMFEKNFDGLPVVDADNTLVGIITQYDLVSQGAHIHLPTFMKLLVDFPLYQQDKDLIKPEIQKMLALTVADVMNADPLTILEDTSISDVAMIFAQHHRVNPIPVVDAGKKLRGIISRYDIIRLYAGSIGSATAISHQTPMEQKVDLFMNQFNKSFVIVSKTRTKTWLIVSIMFVLVGFIAAMATIIRIEIQ